MRHWDDELLEELNSIVRKSGKEKEGEIREPYVELAPTEDEQSLSESLLRNMEHALIIRRILYDETGKAEDFICEKVNPSFEKITGISSVRIVGRKESEIFGEKIPYFDILVRVAETGDKARFKARDPQSGKYFDMWAFSPEQGVCAVLFTDVTDQVLAEQERRLDQRFLDGVLDSMNIWLMIFDRRWKLIFWNKAAVRISGYYTEEVFYASFSVLEKLFPEELYRRYVLEKMERALDMSQDAPGEIETIVTVRDGGTRTIAWTCSRWRSDEENEEGIIAAGRDLTDLRRLEGAFRESERRYSSIFLNSNLIMFIVDPEECRIMDCNDAACRFYGYSREHMTGLALSDINMAPPHEIKENLARVRDGEKNSFVFNHRLKDGSLRRVDVQASPMVYDGRILVFSIIREVPAGGPA